MPPPVSNSLTLPSVNQWDDWISSLAIPAGCCPTEEGTGVRDVPCVVPAIGTSPYLEVRDCLRRHMGILNRGDALLGQKREDRTHGTRIAKLRAFAVMDFHKTFKIFHEEVIEAARRLN